MKTAADLKKCIDDFKSDIGENLDLFLHMQSSILTIHDTFENIKGVCTGGFDGLKKSMKHTQCDPVHIFRVVEKGNCKKAE